MNETIHSHSGGFPCPRVYSPLNHRLAIPGSKSLTNRELVLAALAEHPSTLHHPLRARDTNLMVEALRQLGADIVEIPTDSPYGPDLRVTPLAATSGRDNSGDEIVVECGLAGTVMRFIPPLAALVSRPVRFVADAQAEARPMATMIDALRQLGHTVEDSGTGTLPFTLIPRGQAETHRPVVTIDASGSSQFVSGLLLAAPRFPHGLTVVHSGGALPSLPHIDMTVEVLGSRGVQVRRPEPHIFEVDPQPISSLDVTIEPDLSNAAPFLAAAVVSGGSLSITGWPSKTTQVGALLPTLLGHFGASATIADNTLTVSAPGVTAGALPAVTLDLHEAGELAPTLVALSVFGDGPSRFSGIGHLRGHETDRLNALVTNIRDLGGIAEETTDGIIVTPRPLHGGVWRAWGDHRMATSGALIGLAVDGVVVDDIGQTAKTLPEFVSLWETMVRSSS